MLTLGDVVEGGGGCMQMLGDVVEGGGGDTCRRWEMLLRGGDACIRWEMLLRGGRGMHADVGRCWEMLLRGAYMQTLGDVAEGGRHADVWGRGGRGGHS